MSGENANLLSHTDLGVSKAPLSISRLENPVTQQDAPPPHLKLLTKGWKILEDLGAELRDDGA